VISVTGVADPPIDVKRVFKVFHKVKLQATLEPISLVVVVHCPTYTVITLIACEDFQLGWLHTWTAGSVQWCYHPASSPQYGCQGSPPYQTR
jgi:hypothetical protein